MKQHTFKVRTRYANDEDMEKIVTAFKQIRGIVDVEPIEEEVEKND